MYAYTNDCKVFYVDSKENITVSSVGAIATDSTDGVKFVLNSDNKVTTVVVEEVVSSAATFTGIKYSIDGAVAVSETISATGTVTTASSSDATKTVEITEVTTAAGATWAVSGTATIMANGGVATAANQITITIVAENGTTATATITFQAGA